MSAQSLLQASKDEISPTNRGYTASLHETDRAEVWGCGGPRLRSHTSTLSLPGLAMTNGLSGYPGSGTFFERWAVFFVTIQDMIDEPFTDEAIKFISSFGEVVFDSYLKIARFFF